MKVLWTSLVEFPPLSRFLGNEPPSHCGWLYASAISALEVMPNLELGVLVFSLKGSFRKYIVDGITYYMIPCDSISKISKSQVAACVSAIKEFNPDIIHIHGTEHSLAAAICEANQFGIPMVANIQGLAGAIERYADGGIPLVDKLKNVTPLDFVRGTFILNAKRSFRRRSKCERICITSIRHIIGRTEWDKDHAKTYNPNIHYHFMNETLRDSFYEKPIWSYEACIPHSIFVSNSSSPLKGAHKVLLALPSILSRYPDTVVRFCGSNVMSNDLNSILRRQGYHLYLKRLVKKLNVENNVEFLGSLSENEMKEAFLKSNVYVLPSAIENSPNSLCEAQILGVPTVAAYVGGVPSLIKEGVTGFMYRYEEYEMLSQIVLRLFEQKDYSELSVRERTVALSRHDKNANSQRLKEIYEAINSERL